MKICRKRVAESIREVFDTGNRWATSCCPSCGYNVEDDQEGCDTCFPLKQILHKGY